MGTTEALLKLKEIKSRQAMMPGYKSIKHTHSVDPFLSSSRENADTLADKKSPHKESVTRSKL